MALNQNLQNGIVEQMKGLKEQDAKKTSKKASDKPVETKKELKDKNVEEIAKEPTKSSGEPTGASDNTNMYSSLIMTEKREIKSKRVNFMVKESSHAEFKKKCGELGVSMNDVIDRFMTDFAKN